MGMLIERNYRVGWTAFEDLRVGAIFIDEDDDVNIKSVNEDTDKFCAIVLDSGLMWSPQPSDSVKQVFPTLTIKEE